MKSKMGRPKLSNRNRKSFQIGIRFTRSEMRKIISHASKSGLEKTEWIKRRLLDDSLFCRQALVVEMPPSEPNEVFPLKEWEKRKDVIKIFGKTKH